MALICLYKKNWKKLYFNIYLIEKHFKKNMQHTLQSMALTDNVISYNHL